MKLLSIALFAIFKLNLNEVSADGTFRESLRSIDHNSSRDLALCSDWTKEGYIMKGSGDLDFFGSAVAMSRDGETIAVSAPSKNNAGYIKVFSIDPTTKIRTMRGNRIYPKNRGGEIIAVTSLSMSDNGRYLAMANVENKNRSGAGPMSGGVSVYALNEITNVWEQRGELEPIYGGGFQTTASVSLAGDGSSYVFSSSGSAVGVHAETRVFYFDAAASKWIPKGSGFIESSEVYVSDETSVSMSRDGNTIVIGSSRNVKQATSAESAGEKKHGRVRVFKFIDKAWVQVGSDIYGSQGFSYFGKSVSLAQDGLILAVGADGTNLNTGTVKVFKYESEDWVQLGSDILGPSRDSFFGSSVALSSSENGLFVLAGAYGDVDSSGSAWIFKFRERTDNWHQLGGVISDAGSVFLGASVAISQSGKTVVIGSPLSNYKGDSSGSTHLYELSEVSCSPTSSPTSHPPSKAPSISPSIVSSFLPSKAPSAIPSFSPAPSPLPSWSSAPTFQPSDKPSSIPSVKPTQSLQPSSLPTVLPSVAPSFLPSQTPTIEPSPVPSSKPSDAPSPSPTAQPSISPSRIPTTSPSILSSLVPSEVHSAQPTSQPSDRPSTIPSVKPSASPSTLPSVRSSNSPTISSQPSARPSEYPTFFPTSTPSTTVPSAAPSKTFAPTLTGIVEINSGETTESGKTSGHIYTKTKRAPTFVISVVSAIVILFA